MCERDTGKVGQGRVDDAFGGDTKNKEVGRARNVSGWRPRMKRAVVTCREEYRLWVMIERGLFYSAASWGAGRRRDERGGSTELPLARCACGLLEAQYG